MFEKRKPQVIHVNGLQTPGLIFSLSIQKMLKNSMINKNLCAKHKEKVEFTCLNPQGNALKLRFKLVKFLNLMPCSN